MKQNQKIEYKSALIYCRVSSERQVNEGSGLDSQEQRCLKYAKEQNLSVAKVFRDEGNSGGLFDRPAMQEMILYLDNNLLEKYVVIFDDLKRFARDLQVYLRLKTELVGRGVKLESPNFKFEDSPEGNFVEQIIAATAELERNQNKRQVIQKQKARLEGGYWSFHAPIGLKFIKHETRGKILVPNEPYASIFKDAMQMFAEYKLNTLEQVKDYILDRYKINNIDRPLSISGVNRILRCSLYAGYVQYEPWDVPLMVGKHDGFVEQDLFQAVQLKLNTKTKPRLRKDYSEDFPLRNYILCMDCNKPMTASWHKGQTGKRYSHYWCKTIECLGKNKTLSCDIVENKFEIMLRKHQPQNEVLDLAQAVLKDLWKDKTKGEAIRKKSISFELSSIQKKIIFYLERIEGTAVSSVISHYETMIDTLINKKTALEAELARQKYSDKEFEKASKVVIENLKKPIAQWKSKNYLIKRQLLHMYFEKGLVYDRDQGFLEPNLPILVKISRNRIGLTNKSLVEMARVKLASKTNSPFHCSQD